MRTERTIWLELLRRHGHRFLAHLREEQRRVANLSVIAARLVEYMRVHIRTADEAYAFWHAVPAVLSRCDDQNTYELEMASEAYAWLHLLDRYVRTWEALEQMTADKCLPLAANGVNVLDVGTGPGPSVFAIHDFYVELSTYAESVGEPKLIQPTGVTAVEPSWLNNAFRSRFREIETYLAGELRVIGNVEDIDPQEERASLRRALLDETEYNPRTGYEEPVVFPETADRESQSLHRYRLVSMSNFLTTPETLNAVREPVMKTLSDLQPGAVLLIVGGIGGKYPAVYSELDKLAAECQLVLKIAGKTVRSRPDDAAIIIGAARAIAEHVTAYAAMPDGMSPAVRRALDGREPWGRASAIRVYRRNPLRKRRTA